MNNMLEIRMFSYEEETDYPEKKVRKTLLRDGENTEKEE